MDQKVCLSGFASLMYARLIEFFAAVPGAVKRHLNTEELARITLTALAAGGGIFGVLEAILLHSGTIFPAPIDASMAAFILTTILESYRRLGQGEELASRTRRASARN